MKIKQPSTTFYKPKEQERSLQSNDEDDGFRLKSKSEFKEFYTTPTKVRFVKNGLTQKRGLPSRIFPSPKKLRAISVKNRA